MTHSVALLRALREAEQLAASGATAPWCVWRAASLHGVAQDVLALAWLEKMLGTLRARAAVAGMREADDAA